MEYLLIILMALAILAVIWKSIDKVTSRKFIFYLAIVMLVFMIIVVYGLVNG